MNKPEIAATTLFYSLCLVCLPVAFQFAAAVSANVPEGMWIVLVLSIWASLVTMLLVAAITCRCCARLCGTRRGRGRGLRMNGHGIGWRQLS